MKKTLILLAVLAMVAPTFGAPLFQDDFSYVDGVLADGVYEPGSWYVKTDKPGTVAIDSGQLKVYGGEGDEIRAQSLFSETKVELSFDLTYNGGADRQPYWSKYFVRLMKGSESPVASGLAITGGGTDLTGEFVELGVFGNDGYEGNSKFYSGDSATMTLLYDNGTLSVLRDGSLVGDSAVDEDTYTGINLFAYADQGDWTIDNMTAVVPEPATMSLLALGGLGALIRRKRR